MSLSHQVPPPHTLHIITSLGDGGAEAVLARLCLADTFGKHTVISLMGADKYHAILQSAGIDVHCLNFPRRRITLAGLWQLWRILRDTRPDVVQTWMYHADLVGGVMARLAGHRNVVWGIRHSDLKAGSTARSTILVARVLARLSGFVPRVIVCCAEKSRQVHVALGYDGARMRVIPNGYDLSVFVPDPALGQGFRAQIGVASDVALIGFVARFDPQKDHLNLLNALAQLSQGGARMRCVLVGAGMEASNAVLTGWIAQLQLQDCVILLGPRTDIPAVMNGLDLHVMPSAFGEAFPNVLAEAMACGVPCVSTDVGDAAQILGDTGRVVAPNDSAALAGAIGLMLAELGSPAHSARKIAARSRVADHFSVQRMVDSYRAAWFDAQNERDGLQ